MEKDVSRGLKSELEDLKSELERAKLTLQRRQELSCKNEKELILLDFFFCLLFEFSVLRLLLIVCSVAK